jgi:hypothetical protein
MQRLPPYPRIDRGLRAGPVCRFSLFLGDAAVLGRSRRFVLRGCSAQVYDLLARFRLDREEFDDVRSVRGAACRFRRKNIDGEGLQNSVARSRPSPSAGRWALQQILARVMSGAAALSKRPWRAFHSRASTDRLQPGIMIGLAPEWLIGLPAEFMISFVPESCCSKGFLPVPKTCQHRYRHCAATARLPSPYKAVPKTDLFGLTPGTIRCILRSAGANVISIRTSLNPDKGVSNVRI